MDFLGFVIFVGFVAFMTRKKWMPFVEKHLAKGDK